MTYYPCSLSSKDTFVAQYCNKYARLIGDTKKSQAQKCSPTLSTQI